MSLNNLYRDLARSLGLLTGLPVSFWNLERRDVRSLKRYVRDCPCLRLNPDIDVLKCISHHLSSADESLRTGSSYISRCNADFLLVTSAVAESGELKGAFYVFPVFCEYSSAGKLPNDGEVCVSGERLEALCNLLNFISGRGRARSAARKGRHHMKINEPMAGKSNLNLPPYQREGELISRVRLGDRVGAREIINELLGEVLFDHPSNPEILKVKILELVTVLSRAAVEAGADLEDILGLRYKLVNELASIQDQDELCRWIVRVMDRLLDGIYRSKSLRPEGHLKKALDYVNSNFAEPLSLRKVASQAFMSPFHFSHILKEEMGLTFVEYLTRVRIRRAKQLLLSTNRSISRIALDVGYRDQSYFTKVFRKVEGITPTDFRRRFAGRPATADARPGSGGS